MSLVNKALRSDFGNICLINADKLRPVTPLLFFNNRWFCVEIIISKCDHIKRLIIKVRGFNCICKRILEYSYNEAFTLKY